MNISQKNETGSFISPFIIDDLIITSSSVAGFTLIACIVALILWLQKDFRNVPYAKNWKHGLMHISGTLVAIVLFLFDFASDINMTYIFWHENSIENFIFSLIFTGLPVLVNIITIIMVVRENDNVNKMVLVCCIFFSPFIQLFVLMPVLALGEQSKKAETLVRLASLLGLIETTFESAPQIIVQISINIHSTEDEESSIKYIRYMTLAGSALGLAKSMYNFKHNVEKGDTGTLTFRTKLVSFCSRIAEIGPRVILLALLVSEFRLYSAVFFACHIAITLAIAFAAGRNYRVSDEFKTGRKIMLLLLGSFANTFFFCKYKLYENVNGFAQIMYSVIFYIFST
ncbi:uncharacterized protein LOC134234108 [Saccostrea cucullata]|uniref:uncharacterized protein LOC134234108 n=1 Tax=Saccostrea cuccullata TaxID=36930 RepID=UPI002ED51D94